MGWAVGWDTSWQRDVGYGVPAECDHSDCDERIDRGLAYVCGSDPMGGELGCGLYFCETHLAGGMDDPNSDRYIDLCERCMAGQEPFDPTPDLEEWTQHKATDPSWAAWRAEQAIGTP